VTTGISSRKRALAIAGALAMLVLGCGTDGRVPLEDGPWKLVEIAGQPPIDPDGIVGVGFGTDGRFTVNTGCNSGGGTLHLDGNRILIDSEILQPSTCDEAMAAQDAQMLGVVEGRPRFEIDSRTSRLLLTGEAGEVLLFETP
jgi:heat shock protein HslJ